MSAEDRIKDGNLPAALSELQDAVRDYPTKPEYRTFLFQLLCVMGNWERALTQLNLVADMDTGALLMAQTYRELLLCEAFRTEVFAGKQEPLLFGEPNNWLDTLMRSLEHTQTSDGAQADERVIAAMDQAAPRSGTIDDQPFSWLSDADMRLGSVFEIILKGKYYWVPIENIAEISFSEPKDLRDLVWLPVNVQWVKKGHSIGFMPTRYPGSETLNDPHCALARKTDWRDIGDGFYAGSGERIFTTENNEYSLLQTRRIVFETDPHPEAVQTPVLQAIP